MKVGIGMWREPRVYTMKRRPTAPRQSRGESSLAIDPTVPGCPRRGGRLFTMASSGVMLTGPVVCRTAPRRHLCEAAMTEQEFLERLAEFQGTITDAFQHHLGHPPDFEQMAAFLRAC